MFRMNIGQELHFLMEFRTFRYQKIFGVFLIIILSVIFIVYTQINIQKFEEDPSMIHSFCQIYPNEKRRFLINTSTCQIPDQDAFSPEIRKFIKSLEYLNCTDKGLLTYIEKKGTSATLHTNQSVSSSYSSKAIFCCYEVLTREHESDNSIVASDCKPFQNSVKLSETESVIKVICGTESNPKVYTNVHAIIHPKSVADVPKQTANSTKFGVIFVGIDSMSKSNLARTMPKTSKYLEDSESFVNLKGYTKIGDNTFPNLAAIMTGRTTKQIYDFCNPAEDDMNKCDIVWKRFKQSGYLTGYAEDQTEINTFHYNRKGFLAPPTDYYFRTYFLAAEDLPSQKLSGMFTCTGPENSGERVMNLAKDFVSSFQESPKFGLFWMNSFSHDDVNAPSMMDDKVLNFLREMQTYLNDTIFVFFSDHGFRFGEMRYTYTGWLEERIPFIYVNLPESFKKLYPDKYANFLVNSKRLTNPFDVYMTLQEVLQLADKNYNIRPSEACPKCHSLFSQVDELRTCEDAAIDAHWCVCFGYDYINPREQIVQHVGNFVVRELNKLMQSYREVTYNNCAFYSLGEIFSAATAERTHIQPNNGSQTVNYFLVIVNTLPDAMFEATVEVVIHDSNPKFRLLGDISRINRYGETSECVEDPILRKYCYCNKIFTRIKSAICNFLINCR